MKKQSFNNCLLAGLIFFNLSLLFLTSNTPQTNFYFPLFSILSLISFYIFKNAYTSLFQAQKASCERIEEEINLLNDSLARKKDILKTLPSRVKAAEYLFGLSSHLAELVDVEEIYNFLVETLSNVFPYADCFFIYRRRKKKCIFSSLRLLSNTSVEKGMSILEQWVFKHNVALFIEDIRSDFRFNCENIPAYKDRGSLSFLLSPIAAGNKIQGVVRIEAREAGVFNLDDSRLLRGICSLLAIVLERAYILKEAEKLAISDALTGLYLKDFFFQRLKEKLQEAGSKNTTLALVILDIDDFKKINDTYGHIVGDNILKNLARILNRNIDSKKGIICRFGGEEFMFFQENYKKEQILALAEKIRKEVEKTEIVFRKNRLKFTISLGVAVFPDEGRDVLSLLDKADQRLYQAKSQGKNQVCF